MQKFKYFFFFAVGSTSLFIAVAQQNQPTGRQAILEQKIIDAKNPIAKMEQMKNLAVFHLNNNHKEKTDSIIHVIIQTGEKADNKKTLFYAYCNAGTVYMNNSYNLNKAADLLKNAYDIALKEKLKNEIVVALILKSTCELSLEQPNKAMDLLNQVVLDDEAVADSTKFQFYSSKAYLYLLKQDNLNSFMSLFTAKKYAERTKTPALIRSANIALATNYKNINNYEKALQYYTEVIESYRVEGSLYGIAKNEIAIGKIYTDMKQYEKAGNVLNDAIIQCDAAGDENLKYNAIQALCDLYYDTDAKKFIETVNKYDLTGYYLRTNSYQSFLLTKADVFYHQGKNDSAEHYYLMTLPVFDSMGFPSAKASVLKWLGSYYRNKGDNNKSLSYLNQSLSINETVQDIITYKDLYNELDSTYSALGDYKKAYLAKSKYLSYKDSIDSMTNREDILKAEIDAEEESQQKKTEAEELATIRRHNIQYTGLVIFGFTLLLSLLVLAFFNVPKWLIQVLGFLSFIFLFEFIILILDTKIHNWTHGEPLPVLLIKVLIASMLVPLHHYLEHKVIHFLQSRKLHRLKTVFKDIPVGEINAT